MGGSGAVADFVSEVAALSVVSHAYAQPRTGRLSAGAAHPSETGLVELGGQGWLCGLRSTLSFRPVSPC